MPAGQNGFYYQYADGLITIPYNNIALTANRYFTVDLTDQSMSGNQMDCQSLYIDARTSLIGIIIENLTSGQLLFVPPGFMGWRIFPCKPPIQFRILARVDSTISLMIANKPLISEDTFDGNSLNTQVSAFNVNDTLLINAIAGRTYKISNVSIMHYQPAAGAAGSTLVLVRGQTSTRNFGGAYIQQSTGAPKELMVLNMTGLNILANPSEGVVVNLSQSITGGGFVYVNVSYTIIF